MLINSWSWKISNEKKSVLIFLIFLQFFTFSFSQSSYQQIESNLKADFQRYKMALETDDIKSLRRYLYPDMFRNLREEHPEEYSEEFMDEVLAGFTSFFVKAKNEGISIETRIGEIEFLFREKQNYIFLVQLFLDMERGNMKTTSGSFILGISMNDGQNFTFLAYDEQLTPEALKYQFSHSVIGDVKAYLDYKNKS